MKISGGKPPESPDVVRLRQTEKNEKADRPAGTAAPEKVADKVDLSGQAREIAEIIGAVKSIPEVRTEKTAEIKEMVDTGKYVVDPVKVAGKMIDEIV